MAEIYLSIGSNIRPADNLRQCAIALRRLFKNIRWSPIYQSAAVGMVGDDFLNAVVHAHTANTIEQVCASLKQLEHEQGRVRTDNKFSSRTLDVDLLLYDKVVIETETLQLPRREINSAAHVLIPLVDLAGDDFHPVYAKSYRDMLSELEQQQPGITESLSVVSL